MAGTSETPEGSSASPDDINSRLDEIAAELASEALFIEPSAAERARVRVTATRPVAPVRGGPLRKWRARRIADQLRGPDAAPGALGPEPQPPADERRANTTRPDTRRADTRRTTTRRADARRADARRAARARRAADRPVPDRGYAEPSEYPSRLMSAITIVLIFVLLVGAAIGLRTLLHRGRAPQAQSTNPVSSHPTRPKGVAGPTFDQGAPFRATPAVTYADGEVGIVLPTAQPYGQFSAAQVRAAYGTVRALLRDGYLDKQVLYGANPTAFAALLAPSERVRFDKNLVKTALTSRDYQHPSRAWVTSFEPNTTQLVGNVIKVNGSMSAGAARFHHQAALRVLADYLFVYPVEEQGAPSVGMRIVTRVVMTVFFGQWNLPHSSQLVPWISRIRGGPSGARCDINNGYVYPEFPGNQADTIKPTGAPIDPYDQTTPPPASGSCWSTTGT